MKKNVLLLILAGMLTACDNGSQQQAEALLQQANSLFEQHEYDKALGAIDSLRHIYPNAIDTRKKALKLHQDIELKRSQEELAVVDSCLQAANRSFLYLEKKVEKDKAALAATPEELTNLTRTRIRRDSLQTRFDVLCAKIRYIHKKQKE